MSEMIERVARRIAVSDWDNCRTMPEDWGDPIWRAWEGMAIAAIEAMREPEGSMVSAALEKHRGATVHTEASALATTRALWETMIDEALK